MMKSKEYYDEYTSASFIVILIFANTSAVIFLQLCGNYIQGKKVYQEIKQYFANEPKIEVVVVVKPKKKKKEIVYDVSTFEIEGIEPSEVEKKGLMIETVEPIKVLPTKMLPIEKPNKPKRFGLKIWEEENGKEFIPNKREKHVRKISEKHMPKEETKYPPKNDTQDFERRESNSRAKKLIQEAWRNDKFAHLEPHKHERVQYDSDRLRKRGLNFTSPKNFNETFSPTKPLRLTSSIDDDDEI